jgi:hypothetical protein
MGSLNPFSKPKMPTPVVTPVPTTDTADAQNELLMERKRRAGATGSSGNIASSLAGAVTDIQSATKKSTLLGG